MEEVILGQSTDTARPQSTVPIFFIHSITQPFCPLPGCWCKTYQREVAALFETIGNGDMTMQHAAHFVDRKTR